MYHMEFIETHVAYCTQMLVDYRLPWSSRGWIADYLLRSSPPPLQPLAQDEADTKKYEEERQENSTKSITSEIPNFMIISVTV